MKWVKDQKSKHDQYNVEFIDVDGWYRACLKFDGCMEFMRYFNTPFPDNKDYFDQIHICDIDDFIERLKELKEKAIEYFGEDYPY